MHATTASTAQSWEVLSSAMVIHHVAPLGMRGRQIVRKLPPASGFGLASDQDERASDVRCEDTRYRAGQFYCIFPASLATEIICAASEYQSPGH